MERIRPFSLRPPPEPIEGSSGALSIPSVIGSFVSLGSKVLVPRRMRR